MRYNGYHKRYGKELNRMKIMIPVLFAFCLIFTGCSVNNEEVLSDAREGTFSGLNSESVADIPSEMESPAGDGYEAHRVRAYRSQDLFGRKAVDEDYLERKEYWKGKDYVTGTGIPYSEEKMDYDGIRYVDFSNIVAVEEYICFEADDFSFLDFLNATVRDVPYETRPSSSRESVDIDTENPGLFYIEIGTDGDTYTAVYIALKGDLYLKGIYNESRKYLIELIHSDELPKIRTSETIADDSGEALRVPCVCGCGDFEDECTDNEPCKQPDYILSN